MQKKKCTKCLIGKSLNDFHNQAAKKDGKKPICKSCIKISSKKYWAKNKERLLEVSKLYYQNNKEKSLVASKVWANNNREKVREIHRNWVNCNKKRNLEHKNKWLLSNPEKRKDTSRKYRLNNMAMFAEKAMRRYARKLNATPSWSDVDSIRDVYKEAHYFQMQVDHIVPLMGKNVCGLHVWDNLQLLSADENRRKSNKFNIEGQ